MNAITSLDGNAAKSLESRLRQLGDDQLLKNKRHDLQIARLETELTEAYALVVALSKLLTKKGAIDPVELEAEVTSIALSRKKAIESILKKEKAMTTASSVRYETGA
jgi:hypothetical protein